MLRNNVLRVVKVQTYSALLQYRKESWTLAIEVNIPAESKRHSLFLPFWFLWAMTINCISRNNVRKEFFGRGRKILIFRDNDAGLQVIYLRD